MRRSTIIIAGGLIAASLPAPKPAYAWGKFGHLTVCDLAYRNLTDTSRAAVRGIIGAESGGLMVPGHGHMPAMRYTAFNFGCLEEDEIPRRNPDDHFINYPRTIGTVTGDSCPAGAAVGECILAGIRRDLATLRDATKPRAERAFALFALGHWIGDIHQPLHISFADDRGGNRIDARVSGRCGTSSYRPDNLHAVWDNCLLESGLFERVRQRADFKKSWSPRTITYRAVDTLLANTSVADERQIVSGEPWQWAAESYSITLLPEVRYCVKAGDSCNYSEGAPVLKTGVARRFEAIDQAYLAEFERIAEQRLRNAGFRLAHLLNQSLDPAYQGPVQNAFQQP